MATKPNPKKYLTAQQMVDQAQQKMRAARISHLKNRNRQIARQEDRKRSEAFIKQQLGQEEVEQGMQEEQAATDFAAEQSDDQSAEDEQEAEQEMADDVDSESDDSEDQTTNPSNAQQQYEPRRRIEEQPNQPESGQEQPSTEPEPDQNEPDSTQIPEDEPAPNEPGSAVKPRRPNLGRAAEGEEGAAGLGSRVTSGVGRAAQATGKAASAAAKAVAQAAKEVASGIAKLFAALATHPLFWVVVILLTAAVIIGVAMLGKPGVSPADSGRSNGIYSPPYQLKGVLGDLIAESNMSQAGEILQSRKQEILTALNNAKTEINSQYSTNPNKAAALDLLDQSITLVNQADAKNTANNTKLATQIIANLNQLVALFAASGAGVSGTFLPIKFDPTPQDGPHKCTVLKTSGCDSSGGRSEFGMAEYNAKPRLPITADAVDLSGGEYDVTPVYAPISGNYHWDGIGIIIYAGNGMAAVLDHCQVVSGKNHDSGTVTAGEHICTLSNIGKSTGPHLHFELKTVGGVDVAREPGKDESGSWLWQKMKGILNNQVPN